MAAGFSTLTKISKKFGIDMNAMGTIPPPPVDEEQQGAIDYVRRVCTATGLTVSEIARHAGISASTLTRLYPNPKVKHTLSQRTIHKLRQAFPDIPYWQPLLVSNSDASNFASNMGATRGEPAPSARSIPLFALKSMVFCGSEQDHLHSEIEFWVGDLSDPCELVRAPTLELAGNNLFAAYVAGDAMEPRYRAGEKIILDRSKPPGIKMDVLIGLKVRQDENPECHENIVCIGQIVDRDSLSVTIWQHKMHRKATFHYNEIIFIYSIVALIE